MTAKSVYKSKDAAKTILDRYRAYLARWPVPNEQLYLPTREGETFVVASGPKDAPPVPLLHGTMANAAMWMRDIVKWAREFRVYAVDIIGDAGLSAPSRPSMASDVDSLVLLTLAGVADKNLLAWPLPLLLFGSWGARKVRERVIGRAPANMSEQVARFVEFTQAVFRGMRPRTERIPRFSDDQLGRLTMPVFVLLGGKDITMDSSTIKRRIEQHVPNCKILMLAEARHYLGDQSEPIFDFLQRSARALPPLKDEPRPASSL